MELPTPSQIATISLGFTVIAFLLTLGQRLGDWRSKSVARILGLLAVLLVLCLSYLVGPWVGFDVRDGFNTFTYWILGFAVVIAIIALVISQRRRMDDRRIEEMDHSPQNAKRIINDLLEEYRKEYPDHAHLVIPDKMPFEIAGAVHAWISEKLRNRSQEWVPIDIGKAMGPMIQPPAGIRIAHAKQFVVSGSDMKLHKGITGIDAKYIENAEFKDNRIRYVGDPEDEGKKS